MWHLVANKFKNTDVQQGFTLIEIIAILVIIGIGSALATPSLINSRRQDQVNQAHRRIRSALVEAQVTANRLSRSCEIQFASTAITGSRIILPSGRVVSCLAENLRIDDSVVSISKDSPGGSLPNNISYSFQGGTANAQTIWVSRKDFNGNVIQNTARCIVVSPVGMIRTGIIDSDGNCYNVENDRYDVSVSSP
ncbi:prepilin-type N-terminal cleavage/methylation domain-containing protein [Cyanobacterium stanieri LEGE 03274]|uniref:Prepilin-type N-terminal cleavage/methylation domain-containing protein n=1 Tax=Cyanobacterium stanieri LEGE 03274 TaxID=1828756 RepID=A0ABR9V1J7_9CHRO|nr:prepilin-type N-terminal cleavage/methylation domain-containing protein [Cyanobacterium stanieri]MBE9221416.1 prepilin-type N-terminal cleavage/methylation domain-containing protein [Cyanobacterium stanieri LEGE 03274]